MLDLSNIVARSTPPSCTMTNLPGVKSDIRPSEVDASHNSRSNRARSHGSRKSKARALSSAVDVSDDFTVPEGPGLAKRVGRKIFISGLFVSSCSLF